MEGKIPRTESISHLPAIMQYTIVEIKERGLTETYMREGVTSTIVEIKERGLTIFALWAGKRIYNSRN